MAVGDVAITAGVGTNIRAFQLAGGDYDQITREVRASAKGTLGNIPWTATTAGLSNVIAADTNRVGLLIVSQATGTIYLNFSATIPTSTAFDWYLQPQDRYEVPLAFCQLAVSMAASTAGGTVLACAGTAA